MKHYVNVISYYRNIQIKSDGVAMITHWKNGAQLWTRAIMRKHKTSPCKICREAVGRLAYRPVTNSDNRMDRICVSCVEENPNGGE